MDSRAATTGAISDDHDVVVVRANGIGDQRYPPINDETTMHALTHLRAGRENFPSAHTVPITMHGTMMIE
jgi:hypothetical protein